MFLVSMADIIGSYERLPNDAVRAVAVAKRREYPQDIHRNGQPHLFGLARLQGVHHFIVDLGVGIKLCLQNSLPKKLGFIGFMLLD